jgi:hypothetical protein
MYVIPSGQIHATDPLMVHSRSAHGRGICSLYLTAPVRVLNVTASMDNPDGFGVLWLACWPLVPEFAGSIPTVAVGFFSDVKKSSACLPSEGK